MVLTLLSPLINAMNEQLETDAAILRKAPDGALEVRFKPNVTLDKEKIAQILDARESLCGSGRYPVLVVLPKDFDFEVDAISHDHYQDRGLEQCTYAVAWDAGSELGERLVEMFYTYFPQRFPVRVFRSEEEARGWLQEGPE